jgi:phosphohistidine phosphatase
VLAGYPKEACVALVGHEPWLSEMLARLLGSSEAERLVFRKGGVAVVDLPGPPEEGGALVAYLPPKLMRRLR